MLIINCLQLIVLTWKRKCEFIVIKLIVKTNLVGVLLKNKN